MELCFLALAPAAALLLCLGVSLLRFKCVCPQPS